jgi:hypothetical protein
MIVEINRAPVLTLWATVVAERLGHDPDAAVTLGKAVAGLNAQSKGRMLGIFRPRETEDGEPAPRSGLGEEGWVDLCERAVPVIRAEAGLRAVVKDKPIDPEKANAYLSTKFGDDLEAIREAMADLAASFEPEDLAGRAYRLYERFRPVIPRGKRGWGARGPLDTETIRGLST